MRKYWTRQEIEYIEKNWGTTSLAQIMEDLGRSEDSIMRKARRLGLDVHKTEGDKLKKKWSSGEDDFIIKNYKVLTVEEISQYLNRTVSAIRKRALALGVTKEVNRWSLEEENFLKEKWGIINLDTIAQKLNRSRNSVLLKAHQLSLREQVTASGIYLTPNDISSILGVNIRTLYSWIWNGMIGHRKFKVGKKKKYQIAVEHLCEFMEKNQDKWNSQKADLGQIKSYYTAYFIARNNTLNIKRGMPEWMAQKIERDKEGFKELIKPWTTKEEQELLQMVKQKYTYKEICLILGRSIESVKTKLYLLYKRKNRMSCTYAKRI
ncbi:MAG: helix-turn-helix transcriptional regulator [Caulobacteraceae bacterium]